MNTPTNNTLVVFGSPHRNGCTKKLLDGFFEKTGITEYTLFDCYERMPAPCRDCGHCKEHFSCIHRDLDDFYKSLENCSRIIIASPVYNSGFPAPLKAVIDRLQVYFNARFSRGIKPPIKTPKKATVLVCSGAYKDYRESISAGLLPAFTVINASLCEFIQVTGTDSGEASGKIKEALAKTFNI